MADSYTEFSFCLNNVTDAEWASLLSSKQAAGKLWMQSEDPDLYQATMAMEEPDWEGTVEELAWPVIVREGSDVYIYSEDHADQELLHRMLEDFLANNRPDEVIAYSWAITCSKPRPDEFGGGACLVSATETRWSSSWDWLANQTKHVKPSWDRYFMTMATLAASRATCQRGRVGCVLTKDNRVLSTGYNGPVGGGPDCHGGLDLGCRKTPDGGCAETAHAEQNALSQAARFGIATNGSTIYVTHRPCSICARLIINAGIKRVVFGEGYPDPLTEFMFDRTGVIMINYSM